MARPEADSRGPQPPPLLYAFGKTWLSVQKVEWSPGEQRVSRRCCKQMSLFLGELRYNWNAICNLRNAWESTYSVSGWLQKGNREGGRVGGCKGRAEMWWHANWWISVIRYVAAFYSVLLTFCKLQIKDVGKTGKREGLLSYKWFRQDLEEAVGL